MIITNTHIVLHKERIMGQMGQSYSRFRKVNEVRDSDSGNIFYIIEIDDVMSFITPTEFLSYEEAMKQASNKFQIESIKI